MIAIFLYFPINKNFFRREKSRNPLPLCVFFKYNPKTGAGKRYAQLTDYTPICPCTMLIAESLNILLWNCCNTWLPIAFSVEKIEQMTNGAISVEKTSVQLTVWFSVKKTGMRLTARFLVEKTARDYGFDLSLCAWKLTLQFPKKK